MINNDRDKVAENGSDIADKNGHRYTITNSSDMEIDKKIGREVCETCLAEPVEAEFQHHSSEFDILSSNIWKRFSSLLVKVDQIIWNC